MRIFRVVLFFLFVVLASAIANAQPPPPSKGQGVAVMSANAASRDEAFNLARAIYGSSLRPRSLDELRARVLGGDAPPAGAAKDVRELAELRAGAGCEDAASRRLLSSIAQQVGASALLVVKVDESAPATNAAPPVDADAGATAALDSDAGGAGMVEPARRKVSARLFLLETGDFDAARYEPEETGSWKGTASSLSSSGRFPPPPTTAVAAAGKPAPKISPDGKENKPFYASPWFWAAVGGAILIGGLFYFSSQDTSEDPIHLQMKVPR